MRIVRVVELVLTAITSVAAVVGLYFAAKAAKAGEEASREGRKAVEEAAAAHQAAERDRKRQRLLALDETVERVYWLVQPGDEIVPGIRPEVRAGLNRIRHLVVGLDGDAPSAALMPDQMTEDNVRTRGSQARTQIRTALENLAED